MYQKSNDNYTIIYIAIFINFICLILIIRNKKKKLGDKGLQGDIGPIGLQGSDGNQGIRGPDGDQGSRGPPGKNGGSRGDQGLQGDLGPQGNQGFKGFRGKQGIQGPNGDKGQKGSKGSKGLAGFNGDRGNNGEYNITDIDYNKCNIYPFNKQTREMKCPFNRVLVEIKNDINDYQGVCCSLKINNECVNSITNKDFDDSSYNELNDATITPYPSTKSLHMKYKCPENYEGKPIGKVMRCCPIDTDEHKYLYY